MGVVPESAAQSAERKRCAREAGRRRSAVNALNIGACACRYASTQLANGLNAAEARELAAEIASELVAVASILRRVAWRDVGERRVMAVQLAALGLPTKAIADRLGVSDRSVRNYLRGRPGNPSPLMQTTPVQSAAGHSNRSLQRLVSASGIRR